MSKFPNELDDDVTLPRADDNVTEIRSDIINALRHAIFNIQLELGVNAKGSANSLAERFNVSFDRNGNLNLSTIKSIIDSIGPISDNHIANNANIPESKLRLDHPTGNLNNSLLVLKSDTETALSFISSYGSKIQPHIDGAAFNHTLDKINLPNDTIRDNIGQPRPSGDAFIALKDLNDDFVNHQKSTGKDSNGLYAHYASGIEVKTNNFSYIDKNARDLQSLANFIDQNSLSLLGTRTQTLYQNGITRSSRSFPLNSTLLENYSKYNTAGGSVDGYISSILGSIDVSGAFSAKVNGGQLIVPPTQVNTYQSQSSPSDDDDVVNFIPTSSNDLSFYKKINSVMVGDILTINYKDGNETNSTISSFLIKEVKAIWDPTNPQYSVRINGKNIVNTSNAVAIVSRSYFNTDKYGALAIAPVMVDLPSKKRSLIVGDPRGAQVLGVGFNPSQLGPNNFYLYLCMYPIANPEASSGKQLLSPIDIKPIDVTGNMGSTPGAYTLEHIVEQTNMAFQRPGYNLRFIAFSHNGEFGIMLADSYNGASFSIIAGVLNSNGEYDSSISNSSYPKNVIDVASNVDPLGIGPLKANVASPSYKNSASTASDSRRPTKIFSPLKRNNFYANGAEKDKLSSKLDKTKLDQIEDLNGDGYWIATIQEKNVIPTGRVKVTYRVNKLLSKSELKPGKTIVVQPENNFGLIQDFGRFLIEDVKFDTTNGVTDIKVYDAVHNAGVSPYTTSNVGLKVRLYFSSDSVSFSDQNVFDVNYSLSPKPSYNRLFEIYVDENGYVNSHERARFVSDGTRNDIASDPLIKDRIDIVRVSQRLIGFEFKETGTESQLRKITLAIDSINSNTGVYSGYLCRFDGTTASNKGKASFGKFGEIVRFYDESSINYIDFCIRLKNTPATIAGPIYMDVQIFPTISLNQEVMLIGTLQLDKENRISYLRDERQFGNISERQLSNSAINFIESGDRLLHENGVISGFDITASTNKTINISGGTCLVNGKIIQANNSTTSLHYLKDTANKDVDWFLCVDQSGRIVTVPKTDSETLLQINYGSNVKVYSSSLRHIVKSRKDLLAIYAVSVNSSSNNILITDIRTFSYKQAGSNKIVVSSEIGFGNFKSIDSAIDYLKLLGSLEREVHLRSEIEKNVNFTIDALPVSFVGIKNSSKIKFNNSVIINNSSISDGVQFQNCSIDFNGAVNLDNVNFDNCNIVFNSTSTLTNVTFKKCSITINQKIIIEHTVSFYESNIDTNQNLKTAILIGNNTKINGCKFIYGYTSAATPNMLEMNDGLLYKSVTSTASLSDVTITDNKFICNTKNYYPFIAIRMESNSTLFSSAKSINVKNNSFTAATPAFNAVVAFYSFHVSGHPDTELPKLTDCNIYGNTCNSDQMIIITDGTAENKYPIVTSNVSIDANICGIIGLVCGSKVSSDNMSSTFIHNNKSKLIASLNFSGSKLVDYSLNASKPSGFVSVKNNVVNWIDVRSKNVNCFEPTSISGNKIIAGDFGPFQASSSINLSNIAIRYSNFVSTNAVISKKNNGNSSNISENYIYAENLSYSYDTAIYCDSAAQITNNSVFLCANNSAKPIIHLLSDGIIMSNNNINNKGLSAKCFFSGPAKGDWSKFSGYSIVKNNVIIGVSTAMPEYDTTIPIAGFSGASYLSWKFDNDKW